jgi:HTH-type transcriptional regulator / antitoxin HigA
VLHEALRTMRNSPAGLKPAVPFRETYGRMTATVRQKFDLRKYSRLVSKVAPLVIETQEEFERADAEIGRLLKKGYNNLSIEERRLLALLSRLIEDYEDRTFPVPDSPPHRTLQFLMEQNDLRQADLVPVFGSRGRVSEVVNGKRAISKTQAKALGEFFKVSPELFI